MSIQLPWDDCKVCFTVDDAEKIWDNINSYELPKDWEYLGSDGTAARYVVIFRVVGRLTRKDGIEVLNILKEIESL